MKFHLPTTDSSIAKRKDRTSLGSMMSLSPLSLALGSALLLGAAQTASAATTFTASLAPPGPIGAGINTNINYTATITETGTTASIGTTTLTSTLPVGMTFVSGGAGTSGFTCTATATLVTCTSATSITRNVPVLVPLTLSATTVGTRPIAVSVSGGGARRAVTSNAVSTVVTALPPPAFTLSLDGPLTGTVGAPFAYTATVTNTAATASAGTTVLKTTLPAGLTFVSGSSAGGFACTALLRVVTCNNATAIAPNTPDAVTLTVNPTTAGAKTTTANISGGGAVGTVTSAAVVTTVALAPDLAVVVRQPAPALASSPTSGAMSQVEVRINNVGGIANAPINVTFTLPANVSAPLKFSRIADHWVCTTSGQIVSCSFDQPIAAGRNSRLRIPVTPAPVTLATIPGPFIASVAPVAGEINLLNNGPVNMTPAVAVAPLALIGIVDPTGTYSQNVLDPLTITKYATPLPNALAPFFKHTPDTTTVPGTDLYTIDVKQVKAQILPPGFPATDVFAYGDPARPDTFTYPAHTIDARSTDAAVNASGLGKPIKIQYLNTNTATGHLLPVDHSIHGTNNGEPDIRTIGHLHGNQKAYENGDGYPEAWSSPNGTVGTPMTTPASLYNPNPFDYNNNQESTMLWYHDHALGMTRLNVYAGLAGLYMLRDDNEMAMITNNQLPSGAYEVPLVLQDRMFHPDGTLAYPDVDVIGTAATPSMVPEFFGDVMVVNGVAWPYLQVEPRKYRFRVLNGSNSRFYTLGLQAGAAGAPIPFQVLGTEGGFLNAPTTVTSLTMGPAERYDIIVDFSALNGRNITLTNSAGTPFGGAGAVPPTAGLHDQLMLLRVNLPLLAAPVITIPATLRAPIVPLVPTNPLAAPHQVLLGESTDGFGRILPILGTPTAGLLGWMDPVTEFPLTGSIENWDIFNNSVDAHPVHLHNGAFQVIERQPFNAILGTSGQLTNICYSATPQAAPTVDPVTGAVTYAACPAATPATPVLVTENGWKETVIAYPSLTSNPLAVPGDVVNGQVTRIRMKFESAGQFVWHCHIVEHEDHDMMRPMTVLP